MFARNLQSFNSRRIVTTFPSYDILVKAIDKYEVTKIADKIGVPHPKTLLVDEISNFKETMKYLGVPIVIKPRVGTGGHGLTYANSTDELKGKIKIAEKRFGEVVLQEYIPPFLPHPEYFPIGVSVVFDQNNEPRCVFTSTEKHCIRQHPPTGGDSIATTSISHHPKATEYAIKLLKEIEFIGPALVQFKVDIRDNLPKLLEANGRLPGATFLRTAAGIDMALITFETMVGKDVDFQQEYDSNITGIYGFGLDRELQFFITYLRAIRDGHFHNPPFAPHPSRVIKNFVETYSSQNIVFEFGLSDSGLIVASLANTFLHALQFLRSVI